MTHHPTKQPPTREIVAVDTIETHAARFDFDNDTTRPALIVRFTGDPLGDDHRIPAHLTEPEPGRSTVVVVVELDEFLEATEALTAHYRGD